ncbi:MAG: cytochrome P450 [Actinobacteria bacterium]|nr:cytochrome P450 [Actinomycetota bacterium]
MFGTRPDNNLSAKLPKTLPPGPKGYFLTGNLLDYTRDHLGYLTWCARECGDVVRLRFINVPVYLLNHPDHIEYVLVSNNRNFIKSRGERISLSFLGEGLLTSEGSFWRRQRRLVQPAFHRGRINTYGEVMVERAGQMAAGWQDGEARDVHRDMMRLTLEIVARTLFGASLKTADFEEVGAALAVITERFTGRGGVFFQVPQRFPTPGNLRFRQALRTLDGVIYGIILERRASEAGSRDDLLSILLAARDEAGDRMSDEQLRDEVMTIFLAGHETTANALSWTWCLLAEHPEVEAKLHEGLDETLAGRTPTVEDLLRLHYTDMVVRESLRLYPPAWAFGREAVGDCEIGGYYVPAGTQLIMSQWVTHRDPRYYENPMEFRPERWAEGLADRLPRYAYFSFGGGPRLCIGQSFAKMEAVLLLATIAQQFRLYQAPGEQAVPQPSITLRPRNGMRMVLERRR